MRPTLNSQPFAVSATLCHLSCTKILLQVKGGWMKLGQYSDLSELMRASCNPAAKGIPSPSLQPNCFVGKMENVN